MINEFTNTPSCERGDDLVSFLYGEVDEKEARDFERHLLQCAGCRIEVTSFGQVRESIGAWKEEALSVFVPPQTFEPTRPKSALAALREFFDLSPLWMKGAVAFATVLFCVMVVLTLSRSSATPEKPNIASNGKYTEEQVKQMVQQAISEHTAAQLAAAQLASTPKPETPPVFVPNVPQRKRVSVKTNGTSQLAKRRSLSKSEREQLAADLRLRSTGEDESLNLLGERINQEF
jgi:hypothetical protein